MKWTVHLHKSREVQGLTTRLVASLTGASLKSLSAALVSQPIELGTSFKLDHKQQSHVHTKRIM